MFFIRCISSFCKRSNVKCLAVLALLQTPHAFALNSHELNAQYQQLVHAAFTDLTATISPTQQYDDFNTLLSALGTAQASRSNTLTGELVTANLSLLANNIDARTTLSLFQYLLEIEALPLAENIFQQARLHGDSYTQSRFNYQYALYFYKQGLYEQAQKYLASIEVRNALSEAESDYATLLFGIILQYQKQHREAVKHYQAVPRKSPYYNHAQLNTAVAFIRQGWWTDAQIAIDNAIKNTETPADEELLNRLYLVLGYNQLQHEFYRDARESFRNITVASRYADRALLGIGLCALNQGDYVGAINAFNILKSKSSTNISVTEAHLLYAYAHEQMGERSLASAQYEAAIAYFNQRMLQLNEPNSSEQAYLNGNTRELQIISKRRNLLEEMEDKVKSKSLQSKLTKLNDDYGKLARQLRVQQQKKTLEILTSYLSQAQFGQAKLFDTLQ